MRRRRRPNGSYILSLVPLADVLTNTVGAVLCMLILTLLTAGGVVIVKRLSTEHGTRAQPLIFLCSGNRVIPVEIGRVIRDFIRPLNSPSSFEAVGPWVAQANTLRRETEFFTLVAKARANYSLEPTRESADPSLTVQVIPLITGGESVSALKGQQSVFLGELRSFSTSDRFVYFWVRPDSVEVYRAAKEVASQKGFQTGWSPLGPDEPAQVVVFGNESSVIPLPGA